MDKPLTHEEAMEILLSGVCGAKYFFLAKETGLAHTTIRNWFLNKRTDKTTDVLGMWLWRALNKHHLLSNEDFSEKDR